MHEELIQKFIDKSLNEEEKVLFVENFNSDSDFVVEVHGYSDLILALNTAHKIECLKKTQRTIKVTFYRRLALAASFLLLIGVGIGLFFYLKPTKLKMLADNKTEIKQLLSEENFLPDNLFENAIHQNLRTNNFNISIISPADSTFFKKNEPILFRFKGDFSGGYTIIIFNNKQLKVFESKEMVEPTYSFKNILKPGLYYWKLKNDYNASWGGKFYIFE